MSSLRHGDRVHPGGGLDLEHVDELEHRRGEAFPLEVGLVAGEEQERLTDLVVREVQVECRRLVVAQVVVVEVDERTAGTVVEQGIVVEGCHDAGVERVDEVLAQLGDGAAGVGEPREAGDHVQAEGNVGDVGGKVVETSRIAHVSTLIARPPARPTMRLSAYCLQRTGGCHGSVPLGK
jgi:hypothetical protein